MQCHGQIERVHRKVDRRRAVGAEGVVPICVECHSPHEARKVFYDTNMAQRRLPELPRRSRIWWPPADGRSLYVDAERARERSVHGRAAASPAPSATPA